MSSVIRGSDNFDSLDSKGLGSGQTWQNFTGVKDEGITYTNTTGRAIAIYVSKSNTSNTVWYYVLDGVQMAAVNGYGTANGAC